MTETAPKSRLPHTGVILLVGVVLLIGGGALMVWWPYHCNEAAIAEVERLGGVANSEIVRPTWMPGAVEKEHLWLFSRVRHITLKGASVNDAGIRPLARLRNLSNLWLLDTRVSDAGFEHLQGLTNLEVLYVSNTHISDAGLEQLRELHKLKVLILINTQVTEAGIEKLKTGLPGCKISWIP